MSEADCTRCNFVRYTNPDGFCPTHAEPVEPIINTGYWHASGNWAAGDCISTPEGVMCWKHGYPACPDQQES